MNVPSLPLQLGRQKDDQEGLSTQFKVMIPGLRDLVFKSCDGMESEMEVVLFPEGGRLSAPRTARGVQRVNRVSFSQGSASTGSGVGGSTIFDWYQDVCDPSKPLAKKNISLLVLNHQEKPVAKWEIVQAWPCRWMAPMMSSELNQLTVDYVSFAHEGITRKKVQ